MRRTLVLAGALLVFALAGPSAVSPPAPESAVAAPPAGFEETTVFSGFTNPTVVRFAGDGRVFVAEKSGVIKVFDSVLDTTPSLFTDLSTTDGTPNNVLATQVHNYWDRGLLGMALHPNFPTTPYVYVLYTHDAAIGGAAPRWGTAGAVADPCPTPPGPTSDGCVVSGRLSRLQAAGNVMTGTEQVLIDDWCQQYPSHSTGTVEFGPDGALYASAGDGASFNFADYGQDGARVNPCGDPPGGVGGVHDAAERRGRRTAQPGPAHVGRSGYARRLDHPGRPDHRRGAALESALRELGRERAADHRPRAPQPLPLHLPPGDERALGRRRRLERVRGDQPDPEPRRRDGRELRLALLRGQPEAVGLRLRQPRDLRDLVREPECGHEAVLRVPPCEQGRPEDTCPTGSSSISGLAFEFAPQTSSYPAEYQGALFFADYSRDCIWVMKKGGNPIPSPGKSTPLSTARRTP